MDAPAPIIPVDLEAAVALHHGGPVTVPGQQGDLVVMTVEIFRDMMGVGSDADFAASVASLRTSLAQATAGKSIALDEAVQRLNQKYGT